MFSRKIILVGYIFAILFAQRENRIFWDGSNWNRISTKLGQGSESVYQIKASHLNGLLDGRLYYYLKAWEVEPLLAEGTYNDPLDLLRYKELITALDNFYSVPKHNSIPIISAVIIENMRIGGISERSIYRYIEETRFWVNNIRASADSMSVEILASKLDKHLSKPFDISERYGRGPDYKQKEVLIKPRSPLKRDGDNDKNSWYQKLIKGWAIGISGGINQWNTTDSLNSSGSNYNFIIKSPLHFRTENIESRIRFEAGVMNFSSNLNGQKNFMYVQVGLRESDIPIINRIKFDIGAGSVIGTRSFSSGLIISLRKNKLDLITRFYSAGTSNKAQLPSKWSLFSIAFNF
jgi:hypothetical protein